MPLKLSVSLSGPGTHFCVTVGMADLGAHEAEFVLVALMVAEALTASPIGWFGSPLTENWNTVPDLASRLSIAMV